MAEEWNNEVVQVMTKMFIYELYGRMVHNYFQSV